MKIMYLGGAIPNGLAAIGVAGRKSTGGGWTSGLLESMKAVSGLHVSYVFFWHGLEDMKIIQYEDVIYYALPLYRTEDRLCFSDRNYLRKAYEDFQPDVVHIFGTEREKTSAMLAIAGNGLCILSITGLVSVCAYHYYGGIDSKYLNKPSFNDLIRRMSPRQQRKDFVKFGKYEISSIQDARYVFGRTTWDYACIKQINSNIHYFYAGEVLRPIFYQCQWNSKKIRKHSIFVSQGTYPLKGFHKLLEALPILISKYPDTKVYIAGPDITKKVTLWDSIKRTTYGAFLRKLIDKNHLGKYLNFLGPLSAEEMCQQYLSSHVFVLPSLIENSSNSLGEAMILGVPCVASCVGGVQDMLRDRVDGFLYPFDEPYMMAYYIEQFFDSDSLCTQMGNNARENAMDRFNVQKTIETTLNAYSKIIEKQGQ